MTDSLRALESCSACLGVPAFKSQLEGSVQVTWMPTLKRLVMSSALKRDEPIATGFIRPIGPSDL